MRSTGLLRALGVLALSVALTLIGNVLPSGMTNAQADTGCPTGVTPSGSGTSGSPYLIATPANLQSFRDTPSMLGSGKYVKFTADIDMGGCVWTSSIGYVTAQIDGDGHVVSGLSIVRTVNYGRVGFVNQLESGGKISRLGFAGDITVTASGFDPDVYLGGLVGNLVYGATIEQSFTTGNVSVTVTGGSGSGFGSARAIAYAGGIAGASQGAITDSYALGAVTAQAAMAPAVLGSTTAAAGGLIGYMNYWTSPAPDISRSWASGAATATAATQYAGGLVGRVNGSNTVTKSVWNTDATSAGDGSGGTYGSSIGKTAADMKTLTAYTDSPVSWTSIASGYDAAKTWGVCGPVNSGLPFLTIFETASSCVLGPSISSLATTSGSTLGGTSVVITGANFTGTSSVTFGGVNASSFTVDSDTQITATTPPGSAGAVDVVVTVSGSTATSSSAFTYQRAAQTVTWSPTTAISTAQSPLTPSSSATALGGAVITYAVVGTPTTTTCSVDSSSGQLTYTGTGSCTVRASAAQSGTYAAGTTDATFTVTLSAQTVTWAPVTSLTTTQSPLTPSATASALGSAAITYAVQAGFTTSTCSVDASSGALTFTGAGTCTVRASAAATSLYAEGFTDVVFSVSRATPTLTWSPSTTSAEVPAGSLVFDTASTSSDATVTYAVTGAGSTGCTVNSGTRTLSFNASGSCAVTASVAQTVKYDVASSVVTFAISRSTQAVTWSPTASLSLASTSINLGTATTAGDGAITYSATSSGSEGCTFAEPSSPVLTYAASGSCTVTATAAQTVGYAQGTSSTTISITRATPTISWAPTTALSLPAATVTPAAATATGDGTVSYVVTSDTGAGCSVNSASGALSYTGVGQCTVTATTGLTARYTSVSTSAIFTVGLGTQTIMAAAGSTSITVGDTTTLTTSGSSGTGAITFAVTSGAGSCSLSGSTVTAVAAGTCTITAAIAADANYGSASDVVTITVTPRVLPPSGGGGSGGGGSSSGSDSSPSAQTVVSPSLASPANPASQASSLPPIVPTEPSSALATTQGLAIVNGQPGSTTVTEHHDSVTVSVNGTPSSFTLDRSPSTGLRTPTAGTFVTGVPTGFSAQGFMPGTTLTIYAMSTPVLVATAIANASGSIDGYITLPTSLGTGRHTLVVSGYLAGGTPMSSYLGIATKTAKQTVVRRVFFAVGSAELTYPMRVRLTRLVVSLRGKTPSTVTVGVVRAVNATAADRALAVKRAQAVTSYLRAKGLPGTVRIGASIPTSLATWVARRADVTVTL